MFHDVSQNRTLENTTEACGRIKCKCCKKRRKTKSFAKPWNQVRALGISWNLYGFWFVFFHLFSCFFFLCWLMFFMLFHAFLPFVTLVPPHTWYTVIIMIWVKFKHCDDAFVCNFGMQTHIICCVTDLYTYMHNINIVTLHSNTLHYMLNYINYITYTDT